MSTPAMEWQLAVPAALRLIFARWAEPCDPALATGLALQDAGLYRTVSDAAGAVTVCAQTLARIEEDACYNAQFGQFCELRREGEQVLPWVRAAKALGPSPHHLFVPY